MTKTAPELDTASAVLDAVRSSRAIADAAEARTPGPGGRLGGDALHRLDRRARPVTGSGTSRSRSPDRVRRWWRSSPSPSSPPRWVCRPRSARPTSGRPSSCATASPGPGRGWWAVTWRRGGPAGSPGPPSPCRGRPRRTSTPRSRRSRTRSAPPPWTGSSRPRSPGTCPTRPKPDGRRSADARHLDIDTRQTGLTGTATVYGTLDLADALDLEAAVADVAGQLKDLGSEDSLDVRRSVALGEIARRQLSLDLTGSTDSGSAVCGSGHHALPPPRRGGPGRRRRGRPAAEPQPPGPRAADPHLVRRTGPAHRQAGDRPRGLRTRSTPTTSPTGRPSRSISGIGTASSPGAPAPPRRCDHDHVVPHPDGPTCACNLAPLCRRHHRLKTHGRWRYRVLDPGTYLWTSPHGYQYLVDHEGTLDVSADRRSRHQRER